jgi:hypothetical protein
LLQTARPSSYSFLSCHPKMSVRPLTRVTVCQCGRLRLASNMTTLTRPRTCGIMCSTASASSKFRTLGGQLKWLPAVGVAVPSLCLIRMWALRCCMCTRCPEVSHLYSSLCLKLPCTFALLSLPFLPLPSTRLFSGYQSLLRSIIPAINHHLLSQSRLRYG